MTNKEILAELKMCYEYLLDIDDNEMEQLTKEEIKEIRTMKEKIDDIYFRLWNTTFANGEEDLTIPKEYQKDENETILIGASASADYTIQNNENGEFDEDIITSGDLGYYWYKDELGESYGDFYFESVANGFMKALDEICELSKEVGKDFDYYDKTCELTDLRNYSALWLLDKFGSDNDDE